MDLGNLPAGLRSRRQRSGVVYFYFAAAPGVKEVPLGSDPIRALEQYQVLQRELLLATRPEGLAAMDLLTQFQKCTPRPTTRHARTRRASELAQLSAFFTECGNPSVSSIPSLQTYQQWLGHRADTRNFDSARLFRRIWELMRQHEYIGEICPWASVPSYSERVTLELADVIYPFATSELKQTLAQLLDRLTANSTASPSHTEPAPSRLGDALLTNLESQLASAKHAAVIALANSHRDDLRPSLAKLAVHDLQSVLTSSTRVRHLPPGKIDLTLERKLVISRLRQRHAKGNEGDAHKSDDDA